MKWSRRTTLTADQLDRLREQIDAKKIIDSLKNMVFGELEMQPHQVTAALGLLRKVVPDLSSVEGKVEHNHSLTLDLETVRGRLVRTAAQLGTSVGQLDGAGADGARPRLELLAKTGSDPA